MNKHYPVIIAIASMAMFSCSVIEEQDVIEVKNGTELVFEATNEGDVETKTAVQSDGKSVWWNPYEKVNIFFGDSESSLFTSTNSVPVAKAQFRGTIEAFTGEVDGNDDDYFWAIYPYDASNTSDGSSVTATLSANQTACAGTFADNQWLTVARSKGLALSFRAVCAGFRFSVTKPGIKSVTFKGNNNEILAGTARITMDAENLPYVQDNIIGERVITLSAPAGETLEVGTLYYMTFFPNNFTNGFTVTFNTETEAGSRVYGAKDFKRTDVHRGVDFDKDVEYVPAINGHAYVEMGNGLKWATMNLGAYDTTEPGDYFAWGETEPYYDSKIPFHWKNGKSAGYAWGSYQFNPSGDGITFTKYNSESSVTLQSIDDAARVNWGGTWRMPTYKELDALWNGDDYTWEWTDDYNGSGMAGEIVTSKVPGYVGNSIFLPAAGGCGNSIYNVGFSGLYWSSSLSIVSSISVEVDASCAFGLVFEYYDYGDNYINGSEYQRVRGQCIRPVSN